jgi:hypothetical protein
MSNSEVKSKLQNREDVSHFFKLEDVPQGINDIISECLQHEGSKRSSFESISKRLNEIQKRLEKNWRENEWQKLESDRYESLGEGTYEVGEVVYQE